MILGQFAHAGTLAHSQPGSIRFGMHTVVSDGTRALLQHARINRHRFVASPPSVAAVRGEVAAIMPVGASIVTVESLIDYVYGKSPHPDAWLDLGGDVKRPHRFRRQIGGNYPIAVVHHSVSYGHCIHDWFLPLLLGDIRACDTVICTSPSGKQVIQKTLEMLTDDLRRRGIDLPYRGRLDTVPLGVDCDRFKPLPRYNARGRLGPHGIKQDDFVLLWIGRISSQDKADLVPLLRVLRDVSVWHPETKLIIAGTPRDIELRVLAEAATQMGVAHRLVALGAIHDDDLPWVYAAADVFVSPVDSIQEMFGLSVIEAMACGIPVVCSDWGGYRDSVIHEETGILVDTVRAIPDIAAQLAADFGEWSLAGGEYLDQWTHAQSTIIDVDAMTSAIRALADNPQRRKQMGDQACARARQVYAWPHVISQWETLFKTLAACDRTTTAPHPYERPHFAEVFLDYPSAHLTWSGRDDDAWRPPELHHDPRPYMQVPQDCAEYPLGMPPGAFRAAWREKHGRGEH